MKIRVVWVGKTKNASLRAVCDDMSARIHHLTAFDISEQKEIRTSDDRKRIESEGERILGRIEGSDYVVALDTAGRSHSSETIATFIGKHMVENPRDLVFVVGGPAGLSGAVRKRSNLTWSLSTLTFSHDLARTILMEQLYRALATINNLPYVK
jgi:23S rRNA (pseudouridine1915-N3)-methyltransferase